MKRVLIPVDGSTNALDAVRKVAAKFDRNDPLDIHLVNVRSPLSRHIAGFLRRRDITSWHHDEGLKALGGAMRILSESGIGYVHHIRVGDRAAMIAGLADELACDRIVMATARKNSLTRLIEDSVTNRVLELTHVPVEVIAGRQSSTLERVGIPVSLGAAAALLAFVVD